MILREKTARRSLPEMALHDPNPRTLELDRLYVPQNTREISGANGPRLLCYDLRA